MDQIEYMQRALMIAQRGQGWVEPNPMVGCVIVDASGQIVGEGWHERFGEAHAEVNAIRAAGERAGGATAYVTLEPCCHQGKTGPCTEALIEARVKRVVVAMQDPFDKVAGQGIARLQEAGIEVEVGCGGEAAARLNEPFIKRVTTGLPYVILKWASTIDGAIATMTGDSQWISNQSSRQLVHEWRGRVDAIMVGIGTVLADDPTLTARDVEVRRIARRIVLDPRLQLPESCKLIQSLDQAPLTIAVHENLLNNPSSKLSMLKDRGVEFVGLAFHQREADMLDLMPLLQHLATEHAATNILVEGGAGANGALLRQGCADELRVFIAPKVLGDGWGLNPFRLPPSVRGTERMAHTQHLQFRELRQLEEDILLRYRIRK